MRKRTQPSKSVNTSVFISPSKCPSLLRYWIIYNPRSTENVTKNIILRLHNYFPEFHPWIKKRHGKTMLKILTHSRFSYIFVLVNCSPLNQKVVTTFETIISIKQKLAPNKEKRCMPSPIKNASWNSTLHILQPYLENGREGPKYFSWLQSVISIFPSPHTSNFIYW